MKKQLLTFGLVGLLSACSSNRERISSTEMFEMFDVGGKPNPRAYAEIEAREMHRWVLNQKAFFDKRAKYESSINNLKRSGFVSYEQQIEAAAKLGNTKRLEEIEDELHALKSSVGGAINRSRTGGDETLMTESKMAVEIDRSSQFLDPENPTEEELLKMVGMEK